ncbi:hypothetical protein BH23ACT4_BH23ACT4_16120 [soil metagenome]
MQRDRSQGRKRRDWLGPFVFAVLAMVALAIFSTLQQPVMVDIIETNATADAGGLVEVRIALPSPQGEGTQTRLVRIPEDQVDDGTLAIWWADQAGGEILLEDPRYQWTTGHYLLAAGLGFLLGLVVVGSLRGYGYVRGDGEPGSKPEVPVGEERGFYWRT